MFPQEVGVAFITRSTSCATSGLHVRTDQPWLIFVEVEGALEPRAGQRAGRVPRRQIAGGREKNGTDCQQPPCRPTRSPVAQRCRTPAAMTSGFSFEIQHGCGHMEKLTTPMEQPRVCVRYVTADIYAVSMGTGNSRLNLLVVTSPSPLISGRTEEFGGGHEVACEAISSADATAIPARPEGASTRWSVWYRCALARHRAPRHRRPPPNP